MLSVKVVCRMEINEEGSASLMFCSKLRKLEASLLKHLGFMTVLIRSEWEVTQEEKRFKILA